MSPPASLSTRQALGWLAGACMVWACASWLGNANLDGYHDMLENYAWSQPLRWGTHKHPPFFSWVVGLWFAVFAQNDFNYRLLSYANVFVGLAGVWVLGRRLRLGALAPWGALLLLWSFPYTSLAGKFNANSQLLSLWPWATALLLASWQERGWRGAGASVALGLVAAACMLSKYFSGVFLAGFLLPVFLHAEGRRWLATPRPYLALAVFGLALWPHLAWVAAHDWAPLDYALEQGGGATSWNYIARFSLAPLFYWLPAWLALCLVWARAQARIDGTPWAREAARLLLRSWVPQGRDDVLFWLAFMPWALTLGFGAVGIAELSTPWAIPIGYAFSLLWLRNLRRLAPAVETAALRHLARAWWPVLALISALGVGHALSNALSGDEGYYRPTQEAARVIVRDWQQRHPGAHLGWVGGDWAGNAMLAFYAQPHLLTVPGLPDGEEARMSVVGPWRSRDGLLLCLRGPLSRAQDATECDRQAQQWLTARGRSAQPRVVQVARSGWRFPRAQPWVYAVYDVEAGEHP
ncbi:MAG: glycosyltransferase family 39 protein [Comamonas sp.]|nr:glycosyltransferase family 39 protein [Comamonas sp.]